MKEEKLAYELERFSSLLNIGIFAIKDEAEDEAEEIISFQDHPEYNPIYSCIGLRKLLIKRSKQQDYPFIYKDEKEVYFCSIHRENTYYLLGPMSTMLFSRLELHRFYRHYDIGEESEKRLKRFTVAEILDSVELISCIILQKKYRDEELIYENHIVENTKEQEEQEQIIFDIRADEEEIYHHTYQEERKLLDSVKEGRVEDALRLNRSLDMDLGKLSKKELNHWKNAVIVGITLCTRAAIEGGISPSVAYRISDFYIQKSDTCFDVVQLLEYRNHAVEELTKRVEKYLSSRSNSNYVERCKDYVINHYREKIYLEDIAEVLGISSSYLSRLFRRETGICLQDYINQVRIEHAANLLRYSDENLARIAEYVNFPSQSYFGKIFKQHKNMSPKQYRDLMKSVEFH